MYAEAKFEGGVQIESYKIPRAGISVTGRVTRSRIRGNSDTRNTDDAEDTEDEDETHETEETGGVSKTASQ